MRPGYPAPGYGTPRFDHPYPGGDAPFMETPGGPAPPGFPGPAGYGAASHGAANNHGAANHGAANHGAANHGAANHGVANHGAMAGERFSGQSAAPPGYPRDPGQQPRPEAPGWYGPGEFQSRGTGRAPGGQPYPAPPGPAAHPGPGAFPGPAGAPPGRGYPGPADWASDHGRNAFAGQAGPGQADYRGYAGPGGPQRAGGAAPYAEYRVWQPQNGPGDHPDADYGEMVNGGGYAYVIRDEDPAASTANPAPPRADGVRAITSGTVGLGRGGADDGSTGWPAGAGSPPETAAANDLFSPPASAGTASRADPGPTEDGPATGGRTRPQVAADLDPVLAYGPDDPAYGPPGPDWYRQRAEELGPPGPPEPEAAEAAGEARAVRGPFEPLSPVDREEALRANYQPADGQGRVSEASFDETGFDEAGTGQPDSDPEIFEMPVPELLDFGTPTDPEAGTLGQIRDLYQTAETVSQDSLDRHFDQLLERQRELISEYFKESLDSAGAASAAVPTGSGSAFAAFGFDSAESLAGLRDELRGA